jgi:hypothetical protein
MKMSNQEQKQILNMLQEGKITIDEAQALLEALNQPQKDLIIPNKRGTTRKFLKISIKSSEGDDVKIQIPVEFARFVKMGQAKMKLSEYDIDIDSLIHLIEDGAMGEIVDIKTSDGDLVKIVVE